MPLLFKIWGEGMIFGVSGADGAFGENQPEN